MALIQWYPGHIAKAERQLREQLNKVDVVLEVIDARIPLASQHPDVPLWVGEKPKLIILNRVDMITPELQEQWLTWFRQQNQTVYYANAKQGTGVKAISKAAQQAGKAVNERRKRRGMQPRPVRAVVMGFPNVGKSALINRLLGRKVVESARRAGVTRQLRWIRISDSLELLDSPGVIPLKLENQANALKLAICEDIGEAAYENQAVAIAMVDLLLDLSLGEALTHRYQVAPETMNGDLYLIALADARHNGDRERAAVQLLNDFRKGLLGPLPLELPPEV
ncbi:ribosome biogenesis GTPase YlqF [Synechocystis sp. LEGE 06083]|uniref:ribosome biogenesis GTPase YlqF n=1 Tax=Synechocystis sp. LEGE 06083 TaxID=915336 RepID=UPI00187F5A7D|nr:ribosome biogenesis GTPase YlqF [Synechocystis sp. LEGE 06083]MBE9196469.1 ribosome biogenesis GTPase YlqF [Synechocystis sp. LEGE 06083]